MYCVKDIMTDAVVVVGPNATIDEAISALLDHGVSGLPVVDEMGWLLGVVSEYDIIDLVYTADMENTRVGDYMTREVRTLGPTASLDEAANIFCEKRIRRIPIVDHGRLLGIVARRDLIRFIRDFRKMDGGQAAWDNLTRDRKGTDSGSVRRLKLGIPVPSCDGE